jgi:hypothetical protein
MPRDSLLSSQRVKEREAVEAEEEAEVEAAVVAEVASEVKEEAPEVENSEEVKVLREVRVKAREERDVVEIDPQLLKPRLPLQHLLPLPLELPVNNNECLTLHCVIDYCL